MKIYKNNTVKKHLHLRITHELNHISDDMINEAHEDAARLFLPYFKSVRLLFLTEQKEIIEKLRAIKPVVSMDKMIDGDLNVDTHRIFNEHWSFLGHSNDFDAVFNESIGDSVILYDHDIIGGYQFAVIEGKLKNRGIEVKRFAFVDIKNAEDEEVLDLRDFLTADVKHLKNSLAGLVIEGDDGELFRASYLSVIVDFEKHTSISARYKRNLVEDVGAFKLKYGIKS